METTVTKENLQHSVAMWSLDNFGDQTSKYDPNLILSFNAPLLGIVEECGELEDAKYDDEVEDAIADIIIYTCDFCSRFGIDLPEPDFDLTKPNLTIIVGYLCHTVLKTHQSIRGYDNHEYATERIKKAVSYLLNYLVDFCKTNDFDPPLDLAVKVFQETVSKRNWKNPQ